MKRLLKVRYWIWGLLFLLVVWGLRNVPFSQIAYTLQTLQASELALLLLLNIFIFLLFTSRWWLIIRAQGDKPPFLQLAGYRLAAFGISYFTPGTQFGGEPLQVYLLADRQQIPHTKALAAVSLDKLFELLANFTFLLAGMLLILSGGVLPALGNPLALVVVGALLGLPLLYLTALWIGKTPLTSAGKRLLITLNKNDRRHKLMAVITETETRIAILLKTSPWTILCILPLSGFIWLLMVTEYWLALKFLGIQINLAGAVMALTAARLAFLTPIPAGLGALEASQVLALGALGYSPAVGISISLLIRARDIAFGLMGLWWGALQTHRRAPVLALIQPSNEPELVSVATHPQTPRYPIISTSDQ